jgi:uncharacterized protein
MPTISQNVLVSEPPELVWALLKDVSAVAECMPGVELTEDLGNGQYKGRLRTKLGAITATFEGEAKITTEDSSKSGTIDARGVDSKGGSRASAAVRYSAEPDPQGTRLNVTADIKLMGRLAQFGKSGLLQEISNQMVSTFASNLADRAATGESTGPAGEVKMVRVVGRAMWARIKAFFSGLRRSARRNP